LTAVPGSPFAGAGLGGVAFSPDGTLLATTSADGGVSVLAVGPGGALTAGPGSPFAIGINAGGEGAGATPRLLMFSPDGTLLATSSGYKGVSVLAVRAGGALRPFAGSPFGKGTDTTSVAFSPNGKLLASGNIRPGSVSVYSVRRTK